tara:strand:- start:1142 stop:1780 length:639 start_codon:yes stop_codon:yes gene_type:complete
VICIVCKQNKTAVFKNIKQKKYWKCSYCEAIFLDKEFYLSSNDEYKHYLTHNNDVNDPRYKKFLSNLMLPLIERMKLNSIGLDYGCGPGPALSLMLREKGYQMFNYDPFFHPKKSNLLKKYDFISCSETVEHFHNPFDEFTRFNELLNDGGIIGIMTNFYSKEKIFENWYYIKDPTHVVFYNKKTFLIIAKVSNWDCEFLGNNLVFFKKNFY